MGFSVSGSAAIVFAGMFIAFGMFYTATSNSYEKIEDAQTEQSDDYLEQKNAAIALNTTYDAEDDRLIIEVNNTGTESLVIGDIDVLVDGQYRTSFASTTVDGERITPTSGTDLLSPGEQLTYELDETSQPNRVKVVTGPGVSAFTSSVILG